MIVQLLRKKKNDEKNDDEKNDDEMKSEMENDIVMREESSKE
jgi:hypothetical protein